MIRILEIHRVDLLLLVSYIQMLSIDSMKFMHDTIMEDNLQEE